MITDEELAQLKEAAERATQGNWQQGGEYWKDLHVTAGGVRHIAYTGCAEDAAYIVAANPATVLFLIERLQGAEQNEGYALAQVKSLDTVRDSALEEAAKVAKDRADNSKVAYNCTEESRYLTDYQEAMGIYRVIAALKSATVEGKSDD